MVWWLLDATVLPYGAAKGKAVIELANQLGMDSSQVMSFGDSYNDMEMIKESGIGIVMGNACESLKEVADYITLSNDEDGVAVILEKMAAGWKEGVYMPYFTVSTSLDLNSSQKQEIISFITKKTNELLGIFGIKFRWLSIWKKVTVWEGREYR